MRGRGLPSHGRGTTEPEPPRPAGAATHRGHRALLEGSEVATMWPDRPPTVSPGPWGRDGLTKCDPGEWTDLMQFPAHLADSERVLCPLRDVEVRVCLGVRKGQGRTRGRHEGPLSQRIRSPPSTHNP